MFCNNDALKGDLFYQEERKKNCTEFCFIRYFIIMVFVIYVASNTSEYNN